MTIRRPAKAFSLVELLVVVAIMIVLLGLAATSALPRHDYMAPTAAARQFAAFLRQASFLASSQRTPVRVVFIRQSLTTSPPAEGEADPYVEAWIYIFRIPEAAACDIVWRLPGQSLAVLGGDALERLPATAPGLPPHLVGRWQKYGLPFRLSTVSKFPLILDSRILEDFASLGAEEIRDRYGWIPPHRWQAGEPDAWQGLSQSSPFPEDFALTPFPQAFEMVHEPLPSSASVYDPQLGSWQAARAYWPADVAVAHYPVDDMQPTMHFLPSIEFDPHGSPRNTTEEPLLVTFALESNPDISASLQVDPDSGARIVAR